MKLADEDVTVVAVGEGARISRFGKDLAMTDDAQFFSFGLVARCQDPVSRTGSLLLRSMFMKRPQA